MTRHTTRTIILILVSMLIVACGGGPSGGKARAPDPVVFSYSVPADIGDGWQVADLAAEGFDTQKILAMMDRVVNESYAGIDSVAIVRNNKLLLYWFANRDLDQFDSWIDNVDKQPHILHSTSKSFTSALVGIAIDQRCSSVTSMSPLRVPNYLRLPHRSTSSAPPRIYSSRPVAGSSSRWIIRPIPLFRTQTWKARSTG